MGCSVRCGVKKRELVGSGGGWDVGWRVGCGLKKRELVGGGGGVGGVEGRGWG